MPPGFRDHSGVNRIHDLVVELSLLEHYLSLVIADASLHRPVSSGVLNCLAQSIQRCLETFYQALIAAAINVPSKPAIHGVYSSDFVELSQHASELAAAHQSLTELLKRIEGPDEPFAMNCDEIQLLYENGSLESALRKVIEILQAAVH